MGCASKALQPIQKTVENGPVFLRLKGETGRKEIASHCSRAVTSEFEKQALRRQKVETVEFKTQTDFTAVDSGSENTTQVIRVLTKQGDVPLHDLGFPEEGEVLEFIFTPDGKVMKAGEYPKDSLFFVPPLALPGKAVKPGESWDDEVRWTSMNNDIEFKAFTHSEFQGYKNCGAHRCAEIKITGAIHLPAQVEKLNKFKHDLNGMYLFETERGILAWGEFEARETLFAGEDRVEVNTRLRSSVLEPTGYHLSTTVHPACPFSE